MLMKALKTTLAILLVSVITITGSCTGTARYQLTTSVEPAGAGTVSPGGTYDRGSSVRVNAAAGEGYIFEGWGGAASGTSNSITVTMDADKNVIARFSPVEPAKKPAATVYTVFTEVIPAGAGTVAPPGGNYEAGTILTLTAIARPGYVFTWWEGDASGISSTSTITVDGNKRAVARFSSEQTQSPVTQYVLTTSVLPTNGGLVTPSGGTYDVHAKVTLTAMANAGYSFHHWEGSITGTSAEISVFMDTDISVTAVFVEASPFTLGSSAFKNGEDIPDKYSCKGVNTSPGLSWSGVPWGTVTFALIMEDPDAPNGPFTHWIVYNIPGDKRSLEENIPIQALFTDGMTQGINNFGKNGYGGPCPPYGQRHQYKITFYALDYTITQTPYGATKQSILNAVQGHTLGVAELTGYFEG